MTIIPENYKKVKLYLFMDSKKKESKDITNMKGDELIIEKLR